MPSYPFTSILPQCDSSLYSSLVANSSMSSIASSLVWSTSRYASAGMSSCDGFASPTLTSLSDLPILTSRTFLGVISGISYPPFFEPLQRRVIERGVRGHAHDDSGADVLLHEESRKHRHLLPVEWVYAALGEHAPVRVTSRIIFTSSWWLSALTAAWIRNTSRCPFRRARTAPSRRRICS